MLRKDSTLGTYIETLNRLRAEAPTQESEWGTEREWERLQRLSGRRRKVEVLEDLPVEAHGSIPLSPRRGKQIISSGAFKATAAVVVLLALASGFLFTLTDRLAVSPELVMREAATGNGERVRLRFTDGSVVILNASSSIRFPERFAGEKREVFLKGEAFFQVTRNEVVPFVVHANGADVRVLGTEFNVRAWPEDKVVEVVVAQGSVAVSPLASPGDEVVLKQGEMSRLALEAGGHKVLMVDTGRSLAWLRGGLEFNDTKFSEVLKSLERKYNIACMTPDSTVLERHLTASFSHNQSLTEVLQAMSIAMNLKFAQSGRNIVFRDGMH